MLNKLYLTLQHNLQCHQWVSRDVSFDWSIDWWTSQFGQLSGQSSVKSMSQIPHPSQETAKNLLKRLINLELRGKSWFYKAELTLWAPVHLTSCAPWMCPTFLRGSSSPWTITLSRYACMWAPRGVISSCQSHAKIKPNLCSGLEYAGGTTFSEPILHECVSVCLRL